MLNYPFQFTQTAKIERTTHACEFHCQRFPKGIAVLRNPEDLVLSFWKTCFSSPGGASLDVFTNEFCLAFRVPACNMKCVIFCPYDFMAQRARLSALKIYWVS
jgi:hypothetical protein